MPKRPVHSGSSGSAEAGGTQSKRRFATEFDIEPGLVAVDASSSKLVAANWGSPPRSSNKQGRRLDQY